MVTVKLRTIRSKTSTPLLLFIMRHVPKMLTASQPASQPASPPPRKERYLE
jgi:hypothetical protein